MTPTFKTTRFKTIALGLTAASLALGGAAYAQDDAPRGPRHAMMDADKDGIVTRAEAQAAAEAMFTRMDVNKDGKIDAADREARQTARRTAMFEKLDTNGDGSISKDEFMSAERGHRGDRGDRGPRADGEGRHGKHHMRRGHHGPRHGGGMMMMRMADTNKDGAITREEAVAAALTHFDMVDADKDGQITPEERKAAHEKMRAQFKARKAEGSAK
ncbi:EF-hand domain-containing protein [Novosphingobium decolorationis]|uniref:EF-hand domain-containing protein n=1 Tax=Novosphingobium decolorationis TaxID=2698673 RepID=A0ABX8E7F0_9SPHN|nr:EF-hand domain-containing protein [Novosphingobium decolorationis]QVM84969.1 EF-hand domain-containing protein [Novosphingobium decolorationis]